MVDVAGGAGHPLPGRGAGAASGASQGRQNGCEDSFSSMSGTRHGLRRLLYCVELCSLRDRGGGEESRALLSSIVP